MNPHTWTSSRLRILGWPRTKIRRSPPVSRLWANGRSTRSLRWRCNRRRPRTLRDAPPDCRRRPVGRPPAPSSCRRPFRSGSDTYLRNPCCFNSNAIFVLWYPLPVTTSLDLGPRLDRRHLLPGHPRTSLSIVFVSPASAPWHRHRHHRPRLQVHRRLRIVFQKGPHTHRIGHPPADGPLRVQAFEVPDQQHPKVPSRPFRLGCDPTSLRVKPRTSLPSKPSKPAFSSTRVNRS